MKGPAGWEPVSRGCLSPVFEGIRQGGVKPEGEDLVFRAYPPRWVIAWGIPWVLMLSSALSTLWAALLFGGITLIWIGLLASCHGVRLRRRAGKAERFTAVFGWERPHHAHPRPRALPKNSSITVVRRRTGKGLSGRSRQVVCRGLPEDFPLAWTDDEAAAARWGREIARYLGYDFIPSEPGG